MIENANTFYKINSACQGYSIHYVIFTGIFSGTLVELYGCRVVGLVGCFMISAGYILSAFVQDIRLMYFTYSVLPGKDLADKHDTILTT